MFSDPLSITVGASTHSLPRTGSGMGTGSFTTPDGTLAIDVTHQQGRRRRSTIRLSSNKISSDPLIPSQNSRSSASVYLVANTPLNGYSAVEIQDLVKALVAYLSSSTYAPVTKFVGGEA